MARVHVQTYGCAQNQSDGEALKGLLEGAGHELSSESEADVVVLNSCTVKSNPEQRLFHKIRHRSKPFVIAGCVPQAEPDNRHFDSLPILGPKSLTRIPEAVDAALAGEAPRFLGDVDEGRVTLPTIRTRSHVGIIPLNAGCLSNCSYCKTKHARGRLESYRPSDIERRFGELVDDGVKEVWLTSQDTGAYGVDLGTDLPALLERLLKVGGDYRVRVGMANPQYLPRYLDRLVSVLRDERVFAFLHIPVQSGSDKVLRDMRRGYTVKTFRDVVNRLKTSLPGITIATDVIVGYPTETEGDCEATASLIEELEIPVVNVSKFYPRPGTPAASLKLLPTRVVKARTTRLKQRCEAVAAARNERLVGREQDVLIDEYGKYGTLVGRTKAYVQTVLPASAGVLGDTVRAKPSKAGTYDLRCEEKDIYSTDAEAD
ncbi:tRNA (N(6)-L-threonylcarbamoyladenosine(37)-C(2))-methylthiotransferase [Candidatus Woesearchaeota archaeon]|nr:tRNA (N(6)-L-threonylcarbamoyladenosine(37)-C(2))-methylthiotransferase [Candidatus Woesearchaeota archaeon]